MIAACGNAGSHAARRPGTTGKPSGAWSLSSEICAFRQSLSLIARFAKMPQRYEQEQGENAGGIQALRLELKKLENKRMDVDTFPPASVPESAVKPSGRQNSLFDSLRRYGRREVERRLKDGDDMGERCGLSSDGCYAMMIQTT